MEQEQALPIGFKLIGGLHEYTIEQVLGKGGFGITYKVKARIKAGNIGVTTHFAVKEFFPSTCWRTPDSTKMLYPPTVGTDIQESLADFIYEGKRLQGICSINPNIVQVNEVFEANGTAYYVMEYLEGGDLRKLIKENNGNGLSVQKMLNIMVPIGHAVQCLHDNNMLHLDIKPDNIVMRRDDEGGPDVPVLIDFGLAVHFDKEGTPTTNTPSLGITAGYSPIEQYSQLRHFDPRLDVYAFSATCLYMLTGKDPIEAIRVPANFVHNVLPPTVNPQVTQALELGMCKENASRTASINDLLAQLTVTPDNMGAEGTPPPLQNHSAPTSTIHMSGNYVSPVYNNLINDPVPYVPEQPPQNKKRKPLLITLICLGALAVIGLGIWGATSLLDSGKSKKSSSSRPSNSSSSSNDDTEEYELSKSINDTIYSEALLNAAENGDAEAQNILGECYYEGRGISEDKAKAVKWFQKAADQGYTDAQFSAGACYYDGEGVVRSYDKAVKYFTLAANKNHGPAQYILGACYDNGNGVLQDKKKAVEWYEKAANQGILDAVNDLGACYLNGEGVSIDYSKAVELFQFAAENDNGMAKYNLGRCYENGFGVEKDLEKAVELYHEAANQDVYEAQEALQRLGY